jgi:hypothetical protein
LKLAKKRKYTRSIIELPVKCEILDRRKKNKISYEVISKTCNLSEGGACLNWPKSWACEACSKCLAWIFNHNCTLKEDSYVSEFNRCLTTSTYIRIKLEPPAVPEPIEIKARVAWVKSEGEKDEYPIGLSFLESEKDKLKKLKSKNSSRLVSRRSHGDEITD